LAPWEPCEIFQRSDGSLGHAEGFVQAFVSVLQLVCSKGGSEYHRVFSCASRSVEVLSESARADISFNGDQIRFNEKSLLLLLIPDLKHLYTDITVNLGPMILSHFSNLLSLFVAYSLAQSGSG